MINLLLEAATVCVRAAIIESRRSQPIPAHVIDPTLAEALHSTVVSYLTANDKASAEKCVQMLRDVISDPSMKTAIPNPAELELALLKSLAALREASSMVKD